MLSSRIFKLVSWFEQHNIYFTPLAVKERQERLKSGLTLAKGTEMRLVNAMVDSSGVPPEVLEEFMEDIVKDATYASKGNLWRHINYWDVASFMIGIPYWAIKLLPIKHVVTKTVQKVAAPYIAHKVGQKALYLERADVMLNDPIKRTGVQAVRAATTTANKKTIDDLFNLIELARDQVEDLIEDDTNDLTSNQLSYWFDKRRRY